MFWYDDDGSFENQIDELNLKDIHNFRINKLEERNS